jgi:hypothetical protein
MQFLSKFFQTQDVFVCDFVDAIKACEKNLYKLYVDRITTYGHVDGIFSNIPCNSASLI